MNRSHSKTLKSHFCHFLPHQQYHHLIVAIGATLNDGQAGIDSGHVRVYEYNGSSWKQKGPDIDGEAEGDESGYSVSMSADGSIVAIGARFNDASGDSSGHVRVYKFTGWGLGA